MTRTCVSAMTGASTDTYARTAFESVGLAWPEIEGCRTAANSRARHQNRHGRFRMRAQAYRDRCLLR